MTNFLKSFLGIICGIILLGCSDQSSQEVSAYRVGLSADYPPFEFIKEGKIVGFDVDVIEAVAKKTGITLTLQDLPFEGILGGLATKRIDMAISCISPTPEREKVVDFSIPYSRNGRVLIEKFPLEKEMNLKALSEDLIGVQAGSTHESFAKSNSLKIHSLPRIPDLIQEMKSGRIKRCLVGSIEGQALVAQNPEFTCTVLTDLIETSTAIAFPKGSPLREKINQALKDLEADGTLQTLREKWLVS